jgi:hypothetical protein
VRRLALGTAFRLGRALLARLRRAVLRRTCLRALTVVPLTFDFLLYAVGSILKLTDALADPARDFRDALRPEEKQHDQKDNGEFEHPRHIDLIEL